MMRRGRILVTIPQLQEVLEILQLGKLERGHRLPDIDCNIAFDGNSKPCVLARQLVKYHLGRLPGRPRATIPSADEIEVSVRDGLLMIYRKTKEELEVGEKIRVLREKRLSMTKTEKPSLVKPA
jgi:hypothetical protein